MEISEAKAAVEKSWETKEKIPAWQLTKVRNKKKVIAEARKEGNGSLSSQEFGVGTDVSKIQRSSCAPRWHCERWFRIIRSIHWTTIISFTNDGSKSNGRYIKATRVRWTSSRRSICSYPGQNGRCSQIIENSQIGMSRHLDSSTTTQVAKIKVQYGRPSRSSRKESVRCHPLAGLLWERQFEKVLLLNCGWEKVLNWECLFVNRAWGLFLSGYVDDINLASKTENIEPTWKILMEDVDLGENQHHIMTMYIWVAFNENVKQAKILRTITGVCSNPESLLEQQKSFFVQGTWREHFLMVLWHGRSCKDMRGKMLRTGKQRDRAVIISLKSLLGWWYHHFKKEELESVGDLSKVCPQNVSKWLHLARIGRPDILWSVDKLARSVTKRTGACDRRSARLISYIHHTNDHRQYCHVGNMAQHRRLGLFQDSDVAGGLEDSKSTSGGILCILDSRTFCSHQLYV